MSQDDIRCAKCGRACGYDDRKGVWEGHNLAICSQCKNNLIARFRAFFGIDGTSSDEYGLDVPWVEVDKILSKIKQDHCMRASYIVTDRELWERTKTSPVSILEG